MFNLIFYLYKYNSFICSHFLSNFIYIQNKSQLIKTSIITFSENPTDPLISIILCKRNSCIPFLTPIFSMRILNNDIISLQKIIIISNCKDSMAQIGPTQLCFYNPSIIISKYCLVCIYSNYHWSF